MKKYKSKIAGNLDIFIAQNEDECDGEIIKWQDILIHGDPEGLKSLAALLIKIADTNQEDMADLPIGAREHIHLRPKHDLSSSSVQVIIGRLDAKGQERFTIDISPQKNKFNYRYRNEIIEKIP